ncbi:MAG: hypothetical protein ACOH17_00115 [Cellulomonas sp.]
MTDDRAAEPDVALPADSEQPDVEQPETQQVEAQQVEALQVEALQTGSEQAVGIRSPELQPREPEPGSTAPHDRAAGLEETAVLPPVGATLPIWLPETATDPAAPLADPIVPSIQVASSMPRHRRQPWALLVLSILLALTLGLATYLLMTTRAYERRSAEWETAARTTGSDLTQSRADLEATTSDLAATREQLATAQARIIELADEKAQLGDDRAIQRQLVDYQERISAAAGNVATALNSCIDGQYKLIGYLENPAAYDQADLARFRTDVQTVCGAARDANTALQRELKK